MIPRATAVTDRAEGAGETLTLAHAERHRRRGLLTTDSGAEIMLDLAEATELVAGHALVLEDGRRVAIRAADEPLMEAVPREPADLARVAWHVGNRHLACQVLPDRLVLLEDRVIAEMLERLGCAVIRRRGPFTPEGGAYGHGRTHSHDHGHGHGH